jgi:hypothetical protein
MNPRSDLRDFRFQVQSEIERDLMIAAARRMKSRSGSGDFLTQRGFDIHVHIFKPKVPLEFAARDFAFNFAQSLRDFASFIHRNNAGGGERTDSV